MLFNSLEYLIFFPVVFLFYWFIVNKKLRFQNLFIVFVSYIFYGWWDWRFLSLIILSSTADYVLANQINTTRNVRQRKFYLYASLIINLGVLGVFKYYNFFLSELNDLLANFGYISSWSGLNIILPVGISFYTFQTLSYTIDVYNNKMKATKDIVAFFAYVSFFPQLVAGPIERAQHLLPQFLKAREFDFLAARSGCRQILIGFFKKVVIADNCAVYVSSVYNNYEAYSSSSLIIAAILFSFQIYGDFSGYSDIAIGTARLFGFDLKKNFAYPYFSRDIAEFWRRWHISLSSWFKDYIYIPLGGSRGGDLLAIRNIFIIFLVSGFWHGANWTFIVWGGLNAFFFLPSYILKSNRNNIEIVANNKIFPSLKELFQILTTFTLCSIAWVFFRSETVQDALSYLQHIISTESTKSIIPSAIYTFEKYFDFFLLLFHILVLILFEWSNRRENFGFAKLPDNKIIRVLIYFFFINAVIHNFFSDQTFIYFQF